MNQLISWPVPAAKTRKTPRMSAELARLLSSRRRCRCCGNRFSQLMAQDFERPDACPDDMPVMDNSAWLAVRSGDLLTEDFCRLSGHHFVRAVLGFALDGTTHDFCLGVWVEVPRGDFETCLDGPDEDFGVVQAPIPCHLANAVPPQEDHMIQALLHLPPDGLRPEIEITDPDSTLTTLQQEGLSLNGLLGMLEAYGHDKASLLHDA